MTCYAIPAAAAIIHYGFRKRIPKWNKSKHHHWLGLLLSGGAIFGIVDHLWNGELFLLGEKPLLDMMLGVTITLVILIAWGLIVFMDKRRVEDALETKV